LLYSVQASFPIFVVIHTLFPLLYLPTAAHTITNRNTKFRSVKVRTLASYLASPGLEMWPRGWVSWVKFLWFSSFYLYA